ncbi:MAG: TetR/AcrR family transcriptional regulator [Spirochaetales bacterium]|nr:TetR/AcrR family transcriptional regulator [Spirochaetales bacterium]
MTDTYHHGDLRKAMLKKGMEMLSRDGIENFSMRKLAAELGVSHTAPYRHFKNKTEAIKTILLESSNAFAEALKNSTTGISPDCPETEGLEKLIQLGIGYVKFFVENPEFLKFFFVISDQAEILEALFPIHGNPATESDDHHKKEIEAHINCTEYEELPESSSYGIFRGVASGIFDQFPGLTEREVMLGYWGKVHGLASLLIAQPGYIPEEKRDEVIERILRTPF